MTAVMRSFLIITLLGSALFSLHVALAADDEVKVTSVFDKRTVDLNGEIKFTLKISGGRANVLRPRIPQLDAFESYYTGRTNQFTFINGRSENTTTFNYVLVPKRAGKFTVPPIEVDVDNQIFRTDPIELEVLGYASSTSVRTVGTQPGGTQGPSPLPSPPAAAGPQAPFSSVQKPTAAAVTPETEKDIFLNIFADKLQAYPNEQILLTHSIYTRLPARAEDFEKEPNLSGFWVEEIPIERDYEPEKVIFEGLQYVKADVSRLAIFPTRTGTFEIDPGVYRATVKKETRPSSLFDDFFDESFFGGSFFSRRELKLLTTRAVRIVVRSFPDQGKPADFGGMAGQFDLRAELDKRAVKQNEPIVLTLTIEGEGNIEMIERPRIPELRDVKIYDSDSSSEISRYRGGVRGKKTFEVTLIPTTAGTFEIPSLSFSYFDPRQNTYRTLHTPPYQVSVSPGPAVPLPASLEALEGAKDLKKKIERESRDIHFIKENLDLRRRWLRAEDFSKGLWVANALLSMASAFLFVRRKREEKLERNVALRRSRYASRSAQRSLKWLRKLAVSSREDDHRKFYEEAPRILNQYFADKFNLSAQGLTLLTLERLLAERGVGGHDLDSLRAFYEMCDRVRFYAAEIPQVRREELLSVMKSMIDFMEKG